MRSKLVASISLCALLVVVVSPLAYAGGDKGFVSGWQSSKASSSGGRITVEASKRSRSRGQAKRQVVRARGPVKAFTGVAKEQPRFLGVCDGGANGPRIDADSEGLLRVLCAKTPKDPKNKSAGSGMIDLGPIVKTAVNRLELPNPDVRVMPNPKKNKWNAIPVGYPIWFYNPRVATKTQTITQQGITISISASPGPLEIDTGEKKVVCRSTSRWRYTPKAKDSPTCGYRYKKKGHYVIKTVQPWRVTWSTGSHTGDLTVTTSQETKLHVNELVIELVKPR